MYGVTWDIKSRGIKLLDKSQGDFSSDVRPVFWEELDLLGFDKYWDYPKTDEPLLWASGREYYYKGTLVAKTIGGGFFQRPRIKVFVNDLKLEPVDVYEMIKINEEILNSLIHRTLERIMGIYKKHKSIVDAIVISFSGGKDSVVLLDLVQRVISPTDFVVVFNDTTMELSPTYEYVELIKKRYHNLDFRIAKNDVPALDMWKKMGSPSRVHRWCCSVYKSAPTIRLIKEITGKETPFVLLFDGVRSDESQRRTNLSYVTRGKYLIQKNAHPIIKWNFAEVYLYIFQRKLPLNKLYRLGSKRVGCAVCPFASGWWESIVGLRFKEEIEPFLEVIEEYAKNKGITDKKEIIEFINKGDWKARVGGRDIQRKDKVLVTELNKRTTLLISNPEENFFEWVKTLGDITRRDHKFVINFENEFYEFNWEEDSRKAQFKINYSPLLNERLQKLLKIVAYKTAYCVHCRACEAVCPANAINMSTGKVKIDENKCTKCYTCLTFTNRGCLAADSLKVGVEVKGMKKGIGKYKHFGIRKEWLDEFFSDPEKWWSNHTLGPVQFEGMKHWLIDSEILEGKKAKYKLTRLARELSKIGASDLFVWGVIWTNLSRNSPLIRWYIHKLEWRKKYSRNELVELMGDSYSPSTRKNGVMSLVELFGKSPLGDLMELGVLVKEKSKTTGIEKRGISSTNLKPSHLQMLVLYSLYRYAELTGRYNLTISELYEDSALEGPYKIFGIERKSLEKILLGLAEALGHQWISTEIIADLDNISLDPEKSHIDVIKLYKQRNL